MLSWARKRQLAYGGIVALFFVLVIGAPFFARTIRGPSCIDGRQNGSETGADCGGACALLCPNTAAEPRTIWQRVFPEGGGIASAVLYAENPNKNAGAFDAPYQVKVYDSAGILVAEKRVTALIPSNGTFAVFAPNLFVGERVPVRASFERTALISWHRNVLPLDAVRVERLQFSLIPQPRVQAEIATTLKNPVNATAIAILYDEDGNAVGASQTIAEQVRAGANTPISFVWRAPFARTPVRAEVLAAAHAVR
ncbi:MAG: Uncharacterized protein G01um101417_461 [Parcubacteria group bacterium Gr01-1014_17]|nr:MAG: Uncharacterized protein G01um101417_461 [Parcubacteria group bacterium Gr01-1014_17]